jgi:hypothetical protein
MLKRIRKMPEDINQLAYRTVELSTQEPKEPKEPREPKEPKDPKEPKEPNVSRSIISRVMSKMGKEEGPFAVSTLFKVRIQAKKRVRPLQRPYGARSPRIGDPAP